MRKEWGNGRAGKRGGRAAWCVIVGKLLPSALMEPTANNRQGGRRLVCLRPRQVSPEPRCGALECCPVVVL